MEYRGGRGKAPMRGVFFEATRERWSPTADAARPPHVVSSGNHSIRWSVMLQRHRDEGFYMAMAFVRWCLPPLISIDVGSRLRFR
jgi:hypothetical protein